MLLADANGPYVVEETVDVELNPVPTPKPTPTETVEVPTTTESAVVDGVSGVNWGSIVLWVFIIAVVGYAVMRFIKSRKK
jgi:hypothetical protein